MDPPPGHGRYDRGPLGNPGSRLAVRLISPYLLTLTVRRGTPPPNQHDPTVFGTDSGLIDGNARHLCSGFRPSHLGPAGPIESGPGMRRVVRCRRPIWRCPVSPQSSGRPSLRPQDTGKCFGHLGWSVLVDSTDEAMQSARHCGLRVHRSSRDHAHALADGVLVVDRSRPSFPRARRGGSTRQGRR